MYLTLEEVAARFRVSRLTIRRAWSAGKFPPPFRVGGQLRWRVGILEQWEREQTAGGDEVAAAKEIDE
jgi:predicted DNA-binding transcriptional regulator AlpA